MYESFARRMLVHRRFETRPAVVDREPDLRQRYAVAAGSQLLVSEHAVEQVNRGLERRGVRFKVLSTLLDGLPCAQNDVYIYELEPGWPAVAGVEDVFTMADEFTREVDRGARDDDDREDDRGDRGGGSVDAHPPSVSANHVLVPAAEGWGCPDGPPRPTDERGSVPETGFCSLAYPLQQVTVIDSGYQWNPAWPLPNPLGAVFAEEEAQELPSYWAAPAPPTPGSWQAGTPDVAPGAWPAFPPDVSPETLSGSSAAPYVLVALAGHANFVAGVIAQHCRHAYITIRNHNGSFIDHATIPYPSEASVARSIAMSVGSTAINVGFAFRAHKDHPSPVWKCALDYLEARNGFKPVVVAPAGNQESGLMRFPGALNHRYPGRFPLVVCVGSYAPPRVSVNQDPTRSGFSNFGPWVTCGAVGEGVVSTFLDIKQELEDDAEPRFYKDFTPNALALWNGTSFAAPKITAAVCNQLAGGLAPDQALEAVLSASVSDPGLAIGPLADV